MVVRVPIEVKADTLVVETTSFDGECLDVNGAPLTDAANNRAFRRLEYEPRNRVTVDERSVHRPLDCQNHSPVFAR